MGTRIPWIKSREGVAVGDLRYRCMLVSWSNRTLGFLDSILRLVSYARPWRRTTRSNVTAPYVAKKQKPILFGSLGWLGDTGETMEFPVQPRRKFSPRNRAAPMFVPVSLVALLRTYTLWTYVKSYVIVKPSYGRPVIRELRVSTAKIFAKCFECVTKSKRRSTTRRHSKIAYFDYVPRRKRDRRRTRWIIIRQWTETVFGRTSLEKLKDFRFRIHGLTWETVEDIAGIFGCRYVYVLKGLLSKTFIQYKQLSFTSFNLLN